MARLLPPERDIGVLNTPVRACLGLGGAFLVVILSLGLLERLGLAAGAALTGVIGAAIALFGFAALLSHSRRAPDFYVADRKISGAFGGLAGAAAFAGLLALGLSGGSYASRGAFLSATLAIAAGYLVLALFIAPRLRGLGAYTPGDVLAARLGRSWVRVAWAAVAFFVSTLLLIAVLKILGPLLTSLLGFRQDHAFYAAAALLALAAFPGGMRSLTWTQAVQYCVIALACVLTAAFVFERETAVDVAMIEYLDALRGQLPGASGTASIEFALSLFLTIIGTASLPHLLMRVLAMRPFGGTGTSIIWNVFFSAIVLLTALVLADLLAGNAAAATDGGPISSLVSHLSGLPTVLIGLVFAGLLAALLAFGQAVLFASASALSHDIWDEMVDRSGAEGRRIVVARMIVVAVAWSAATIAESWSLPVPALIDWAFALAAAGAFTPLLLGLWWSRCTHGGALAGMLSGFGLAATMFLMAQDVVRAALVSEGWVGLGAPAAAAAGIALALIVTIGVSLITPAPRAARDKARSGTTIRERPA